MPLHDSRSSSADREGKGDHREKSAQQIGSPHDGSHRLQCYILIVQARCIEGVRRGMRGVVSEVLFLFLERFREWLLPPSETEELSGRGGGGMDGVNP